MKILREFEKKLEEVFEGVFLRAFKSGVQPVEIGKKLIRELEDHKTIGVSRIYAPNRYEIGLSSKDFSRFESFQSVLATEFENLLMAYMKDKSYSVVDRPEVFFREVERLREGEFWIRTWIQGELPPAQRKKKKGKIEESESKISTFSLELLDSGEVPPMFPLESDEIKIGRLQTNDIVLPDPNVSRVHAKIEKRNESFFILDLNSTNGTYLNEKRITEARLRDGDIIRVGSTRLLFRRAPG